MGRLSHYFDINTDTNGNEHMEVYLEGIGLLPPQVTSMEQRLERVYRGYLREASHTARYQYLRALQERDVDAYMRFRFWHPRHLPFVWGKA